jgi:hypothetical protein
VEGSQDLELSRTNGRGLDLISAPSRANDGPGAVRTDSFVFLLTMTVKLEGPPLFVEALFFAIRHHAHRANLRTPE